MTETHNTDERMHMHEGLPRTATPALVSVSGLCFDYPGHRALADLEFELHPGSVTALVGPNGAGKTTLLRCLAALEPAHAGRVLFDGIDVAQAPRRAHAGIGYLPDNFGLYAELSASRCLEYAGRSHGLRGDDLAARVRACAARVGLQDRLAMRAGHLSRGQRQRLALAQAMLPGPKLLLLDEPASGLDPEARAALATLMRELARDGTTLVVSSHILAELESYCTSMLVLRGGRLVEHQSTGVANAHAGPARRRVRIQLVPSASIADLLLPAALIDAQIAGATIEAEVQGDDAALAEVLRELVRAGFPVSELAVIEQTLQHSYLAAVSEART